MGFTVHEVTGRILDDVLEFHVCDLLSGREKLVDFDADDFGCLFLKSLLVGRDESLGFDDRCGNKLVCLRVDDGKDGDHALVDQSGTVPDDTGGNTDRRFSVDIDAIRMDGSATGDLMVDEVEDISVFTDKGVICRKTTFHTDSGMKLEHSVFSMDWHEIFRPGKLLEKSHFLTAGVSGGMEVGEGGIGDDFGAKSGELVDQCIDAGGVSRNGTGGENDGIPRDDVDEAMVASGDSG